jgi:hypothetical protein
MTSESLFNPLFRPASEVRGTIAARAAIVALFVAGLIGWAYVMGFGRVPLDFHDWTGINIPRLMFLQNALRGGDWPLHMTGTASLHGVTDRYLALPDVITSPQSVLLVFMSVERFILVDVLIHFSLGFAGLLLLRRHFDWSLFTLAVVFLMFLFNGHILAHYSVGHFTWGAYFLFPVLALFLFRFLDGDSSWRTLACFAFVMAYMVLAGGEHHMTWVLLLMALLVPFCWRRAWWLVAAALASGLLSAVRLLPPALELHSFRSAGLVADILGFPSLSHLLISLAFLRRESAAFNEALPGNIWFFDAAFFEFTAFVGLAGLAILAVGLYHWLRSPAPRYYALAVPVFLMTALSIGSMYRLVRALAIPLLEGERYTARMFSLPLLFLIVLAATAIDRLLRDAAAPLWRRGLALAALIFLAADTAASVRLWRVAVSSGLFGPTSVDAAGTLVAHRADPAYVTVATIGLAVSVATAAVLAVLVYRERATTRAQSA